MKEFDELHDALQQMIDQKNTMNVPAREDEDADLILATGIKEHKEMHELIMLIKKDLKMRSSEDGVVNISNFIWVKINNFCET